MSTFTKYEFKGKSGYIAKTPGNLLGLGHTALLDPWTDPEIHYHEKAEEFYLILRGRMFLLVNKYLIDLLPNEILLVRANINHTVIALGDKKIEHLGFRRPFIDDKVKTGSIPDTIPELSFTEEREIIKDEFVRIPLENPNNTNWWLFGYGSAKINSENIIWLAMDVKDVDQFNSINYDEQKHSHSDSWEYYGVIMGTDILEIEGKEVKIQAGQIIEVPPSVCHRRKGLEYPFRGFTMRAPLNMEDKIICK